MDCGDGDNGDGGDYKRESRGSLDHNRVGWDVYVGGPMRGSWATSMFVRWWLEYN